MGLSLTRLSDGVIIEINDSYSTFTGYTRQDIIGRKISELNIWVNPADRERMLKLMKDKGRVTNEQFYFHVKSGDIHPVLVSAEKINIGGEDCMLVMALDISERNQAEEELKESEEKYKQIFDNVNAVIVRIDKYGKVTEINSRAEEFFGFKPEDVLGKPFTEIGIISVEDMPKMVKMFGDIFSGTQLTYHGELETKDKDGNNKYIDVNSTIVKKDGQLDSTISIVYDITERRKAEAALQRSEENFRRTLEDSPFGILILNSDDDTIYINRALLEIFGYDSIEEFRSIPIQARYTPESWQP